MSEEGPTNIRFTDSMDGLRAQISDQLREIYDLRDELAGIKDRFENMRLDKSVLEHENKQLKDKVDDLKFLVKSTKLDADCDNCYESEPLHHMNVWEYEGERYIVCGWICRDELHNKLLGTY